jgi:hypothetical protein
MLSTEANEKRTGNTKRMDEANYFDVYECSMYVRVVRTIIETCKSP